MTEAEARQIRRNFRQNYAARAVALPKIPDRFEAMVRLAHGEELRSIVIEVQDGLRVIDELYQEMESAGRGAFLILRGRPGSGKTTFLNTIGLFRDGVETVAIDSRESIPQALENLPNFTGRLRVVVIKAREALASTSKEELEAALHSINQFIRSPEGEHTLVAWPCNKDDLMNTLAAMAREIGGGALLGVHNAPQLFQGPPPNQYLAIAKRTIETLNAGASLANLGITEEQAQQLATKSATIGDFLQQLSKEGRSRWNALASRLPEKDWHRLWIVVVAGNDPDGDVAALTRGVHFSVDIDRLLASTGGNITKSLKAQADRLGLLGTRFDARIVHLPTTTVMAILGGFADDSLRQRLMEAGVSLGRDPEQGLRRLRESELALALLERPAGMKRHGRRPTSKLKEFMSLTQFASGDDGALNRTIGQALVVSGLVAGFHDEAPLGTVQVRSSDLLCHTETGPVRLEFMWRAHVSRADIANYTLTKLTNYGRAIGFLNGQH